jgi:hypothetical protein
MVSEILYKNVHELNLQIAKHINRN